MAVIKYLIMVTLAQFIEPYYMEISIIVAVMVVGIIIQHFLKLKEEKEERMQQENEKKNQQQAVDSETAELMFAALEQLGCRPEKNDDGTLSVRYQGEKFDMEFGGRYARIWDLTWYAIKMDDPLLPILKEAINAANFDFGATVVLSDPNDDGMIAVHSRWDIMLHPACPENAPFVKAALESFFKTKENVRTNYHHLRTQQPFRRP